MSRRNSLVDDDGFTLVELLVVLLVLGILAATVILALGTFRGDSATSACRGDGRNVSTAAVAYQAQHHGYPSGADSAARMQVLVDGGYLDHLPDSKNYTITLDDNGDVTGTLSVANGSGGCFP